MTDIKLPTFSKDDKGAWIYLGPNGKRVPSVTTIIGRFDDKGALINWAFNTGTAQAEENEERAKEGKPRLHYNLYRKGDADVGTITHKLVEAHICHREAELDFPKDLIDKAQVSFEAYLRWQDMTKIEFEYLEFPLVSDIHKFGGCPDGVGIAGGKRAMVDFKSSKKVWWSYHLQLAAYGLLWDEHYPQFPLEGGYHILRFSKNGDFGHNHFPSLKLETDYFLALRSLYDLEKTVKSR